MQLWKNFRDLENQMGTLLIVGAGGHGKVVADTAEITGQWDKIVFADVLYPELSVAGYWPIVIDSKQLLTDKADFSDFVVAIGDNATRYKLQLELTTAGLNPVNIIHPNAIISRYVEMGKGCVIFAGAVINVDTTIGDACIINTAATIDHDCTLGDSVHISPGVNLAGQVKVDDFSWIGIGASVKQLVTLGKEVVLGAGAVAINEIPDGITAIGIPAKPL
jgi:sugar O-acyltransferase (sialic acid O-acetyltransferase NeuD family)